MEKWEIRSFIDKKDEDDMNNEYLPVSFTQTLPCSQYTVEHPGSVCTETASDWSFVNREALDSLHLARLPAYVNTYSKLQGKLGR